MICRRQGPLLLLRIFFACAFLLPLETAFVTSLPQPGDPFVRGLVLKGVREYCQRLERAALDFVCMEEVSEKLDSSREKQEADVRVDPRITSGVGGVGRMGMSGRPMTFNPSAPPRTATSTCSTISSSVSKAKSRKTGSFSKRTARRPSRKNSSLK